MNINLMNRNDDLMIRLVHYFITVENYTPIVVKGVKDEIWLENLDAPYRIVRINSNYIHNKEQYELDIYKTQQVMAQIKKKTLSLNVNTLNILVNMADNVDIEEPKNIFSIKVDKIENIYDNKSITDIFPKIKSKLLKDKEGIDLIVNVTNDINTKTIKDNETFANIFRHKRSIITPILIGICVLMFLVTLIVSRYMPNVIYGITTDGPLTTTLVLLGGNIKLLILHGQLWRLFTSMFLHVNAMHLLFNMYALFVLGKELESILGKAKFSLVYVISGIIASLFSVVLNDLTDLSVGASGAIFGLLGAMLYFGYHYRLYLGNILKSQIIPVILLNLIVGFFIFPDLIDNFAHIGGLIGGYLGAMALGIPGKERKKEQINGAIVLCLLVIFLSVMLFRY